MTNKISFFSFLCILLLNRNNVEAGTLLVENTNSKVHQEIFDSSLYHINETFRGNWLQAMLYCKSHNMDLVSIESKKENDFLYKILKRYFNTQQTWYWTSGTTLPYDKWVWMATGSPITYSNWHLKNPDNYDGNEAALEVKYFPGEDLYWNDKNQNHVLLAICEAQIVKSIDDDNVPILR
ncbi:lectin subunit alpha-like [Diabrotica undecimpunctata]|uniref:lectin subunit alpha-like n=1 Tax=Diabrotica undecimpunctata TaxID=50387 RepID=UPI003B632D03